MQIDKYYSLQVVWYSMGWCVAVYGMVQYSMVWNGVIWYVV